MWTPKIAATSDPVSSGFVRWFCTTWIPQTEVRKVDTHEEPDVVTTMEDLADLADGAALVNALSPLVDAYGRWIEAQGTIPLDSDERNDARKRLLKKAARAKDRIRAGIELLSTDEQTRESFQLMNRAMAASARQRSPQRYGGGKKPAWRLFQLAFVLLNLVGISDPMNEAERNEVELIFFPTGGGKTEAYLGVIGFTLLLRRLRGQKRPDCRHRRRRVPLSTGSPVPRVVEHEVLSPAGQANARIPCFGLVVPRRCWFPLADLCERR